MDVFTEFDFKKVASVYQMLNWKWYSSDNTSSVPDEDRIRKQVNDHIEDAIDTLNHNISKGNSTVNKTDDDRLEYYEGHVASGGISVTASRYVDDDGEFDYCLDVKFIAEESSSY